jgi:hypothetical protein
MHRQTLFTLAFLFHASILLVAAEPATKPATVAQALQALDLTKLPAMTGTKEPPNRSVGNLSYIAPGDCKAAFEFHRAQLKKLKWTEQPGAMVTDMYGSGMFARDGFLASLSTSPQGTDVFVAINLHGNVDLSKLPNPAGLESLYVGPQVAMYTTKAAVKDTAAECKKLLLAQGWQVYGEAADTRYFTQNAIRLLVTVSEAPAQMGKTSVSFTAEQLSADIPAPVETVQLQYSDSTKELLFDTKSSEDEIEKFYRDTLTKLGWKATTDKPFAIDWKRGLTFRSAAKEMLSLEMYTVEEEKVLRVVIRYQTAAEVDAEEKRFQEAMAAKKNAPKPEVATVKIEVPKGAEFTEVTAQQLEFTVATGKAKAAASAIRKALTKAGWEETVIIDEALAGQFNLEMGEAEISIQFVDTGVLPAEFTIRGTGVNLER